MRKREGLERAIAGEKPDRVPFGLLRHFPGNDQRAVDLARTAVDFQRAFDSNFLCAITASWWLIISETQGDWPMMQAIKACPAQRINCNAVRGEPDLEQGRSLVPYAVAGGLSDRHHLHQRTPTLPTTRIRDAVSQTDVRRLVSTGSGFTCVDTPRSNLRNVRAAAQSIRT